MFFSKSLVVIQFIAVLTIMSLAVKAARSNPVDAIRDQ